MKATSILFDLDGTLVDTAPDLMDAHNHVMKKFGHKEKKLSDIKSLFISLITFDANLSPEASPVKIKIFFI